jgi:hypothetical protein
MSFAEEKIPPSAVVSDKSKFHQENVSLYLIAPTCDEFGGNAVVRRRSRGSVTILARALLKLVPVMLSKT